MCSTAVRRCAVEGAEPWHASTSTGGTVLVYSRIQTAAIYPIWTPHEPRRWRRPGSSGRRPSSCSGIYRTTALKSLMTMAVI